MSHAYSATGPYLAFLESCCRLGGSHINNTDGEVRVETVVDLAATSASPVSSISPIVDCPVDALCQFTVPATDADGQPLAWRLSSSAEAGGFSGFSQPTGASVNGTTGLYSWDTTGAVLAASGSTFYSTQVTIENVVSGTPIAKIAVDFFIRLGSNSTNQQPVFTAPTPADGTVINATVGSPVTFSTRATDPDTADAVTLAMLGKPAAATYSTTVGNPATGTFTWTPTATGDTILTLTAVDSNGLGATQRSVTIHVTGATASATTTTYTGALTGTYSDPLSLAGRLVDGSAAGVAGKSLGFTVGTSSPQTATAGPTDASGDASTTLAQLFQDAGTIPVTASFAGDTLYSASSGTASILVSPDSCTLTYTGLTSVPPLTSTVLQAQLADPDTTPGDLSGHAVTFSVADSAQPPVTTSYSATTDANGVASSTVPLNADVYAITASFAGDAKYAACATTSSTLVTVASAANKVTGGGWASNRSGRFNFGFNLIPQTDGTYKGQLQTRSNADKNNFHGRTVTSATQTAVNKVTWSGTGTYNGQAATFVISVVDLRSGSKGSDSVDLVIRNAAGSVLFTTGGAVPLKGGNITVH